MLKRKFAAFSESPDIEFMTFLTRQLETSFSSTFELSTGLSMETLWHVLRPAPFYDKAGLDRSLELDRLASQFDFIRWRANATIISLSTAHKTLEEAYVIVRNGQSSADELVRDLATTIESLAASIGDQEVELHPFLGKEFEHLRQLSMLQAPGLELQGSARRSDLVVLSSASTKATMMLAASKGPAATLQFVDCLAHQDIHCWDGKLISGLWQRLQSVRDVSLRSLALLESELSIMGRCISEFSAEIAADPLDKLNELLGQLLSRVFAAHDAELKDLVAVARSQALQHMDSVSIVARVGLGCGESVFDDVVSKIDVPHLRQISRDHLIPAVIGIAGAESLAERKTYFSALAWIQFSVGLVKLFVPDRVFDPQLRLRVEMDFSSSLRGQLQGKISALRTLEDKFSGQGTSAQIEFFEQELSEIVSHPESKQPVFRPEVSELDKLHTECSNVLNIATGSTVSSLLQLLDSPNSADETRDVLELTKFNVQRLVERFSGHFEAYQDMTAPIANALRCLLVGLSLCEASTAQKLQSPTEELVKAAPFFGAKSWDASPGENCRKSFEYLRLVSAMVAVEGLEGLSRETCESVFQCLHSFFDDWSRKLEAERRAEAERTSMYRFRGTLEDEEEIDEREYNELFPTYDDDESGVKRSSLSDQVRSTSLKVAKAHKAVFLERLDPADAIRDTCMAVGQRVAEETSESSSIDRGVNGKMLAASSLLVSEGLDRLKSSSVDKSYNFYTDANLPEARKLVALACKVKARFRELQRVDEIGHMQPLADVIQSCDKLFDQVHAEPLAKLIPKLEQLHAFVYEWQFGGWASKVYAVLPLHEALTETVIRWRRLELATWANLFDMEEQKCRDDAYSWWFVAYQVAIAAPLSMVESPAELRTYATSLIQSLETYISSSIVGQFETRLALLRQLLSHLRLLSRHHPNLEVIHHAVGNFVGYFSRYQGAARTAIETGRVPIERKMKYVLLMASWKDTNISALRESAQKSHQKLFRLVRKFRGVLGRDMKTIIAQGLPDEKLASGNVHSRKDVVADALELEFRLTPLNEVLPGWLDDHRRLVNAGTTLSVLTRIAQSLAATKDAAQALDEFVSDLNASVAELRQETPSVLSDETKQTVKHLATQKRRLLADTIRDLRTMGFRHNLAQDKLADQESLVVVLASMPPVEVSDSPSLDEAEYLLHKTLDLAPRARVAAREHSEDLSGAEVGRCIGYVEGMLKFALSQRRKIARASHSCTSLQALAEKFRRLGNFRTIGKLVRRQRNGNWSRLLPWLAQILRFAAKLAQVHGRLGQTDFDAVAQELQAWAARVDARLVLFGDLGQLPAQLSSEAHLQLEADVAGDLEALRRVIDGLIRDKPSFAFVLQQVLVWTQVDSQETSHQNSTADMKNFADAVSTLVDTILVAVESAKKAAASSSLEQDEAGWLMKHDDAVFSLIHQLHMTTVERSLGRCIQLVLLVNLNEPGASTAAMSIVGLAAPLLDQFMTLCRQRVERGIALHRATVNMAHYLTKVFTQIASQGFCTPQEKSDEQSGDAGQLESGTGLGEGEGAEDISKDIQPDEDLSELAQEASKGDKQDIEDEKDAVDIADEDLEGEMGSVGGSEDDEQSQDGKDNDDNNDNDMDEEAGEVDDLDPTAVDEKMWDGDDEKAEKDQQGNKPAGHEQDDDQMALEEAAGQDEKEKKEQGKQATDTENEEQEPEEETADDDAVAQEEVNRQDQNVEENSALELPEDMELDFDDHASASSGSDDLDAMSDAEDQPMNNEETREEDGPEEERNDDTMREELEKEGAEEKIKEDEPEAERGVGPDEVQEEMEQEIEEHVEEEQPEQASNAPADQAKADVENAAPSDVKSSGLDQNADETESNEPFHAEAAQQQNGKMGESAAEQEASAGSKGPASRSQEPPGKTEQDGDVEEATTRDPFRKLGDALEKWHRQQADIRDADLDEKLEQDEAQSEADQARSEFQHLQNDEAAAETQAMGTAGPDEVRPVDESTAMEEQAEDPQSRVMEADGEEDQEDVDVEASADAENTEATEAPDRDRTGAKTRQGNYNREQEQDMGEALDVAEDSGAIDEAEARLSSTNLSDETRPLRDYGECVRQWSEFQSKSHGLSLSLTSQLRLILTPSQSTKLSGAFRTGKRLNIKRVIPYIASSYKRDKIWMRRSVPTKRRYQILVCVDDSKSMRESSGQLAMESLVMVSRALTMLEAGEVGVVGFGSTVFTAHELAEPFAGDAGAKVLQRFGFAQAQTDIARLVRQTVDTFRAAKRQAGGPGSELWQLALVLSDGLTPSGAHDAIRRLLREAAEERVMIVFIVLDGGGARRADSVLELKEAKFVQGADGESRMVIERYLDTFPFPYYLIVRDLDELPSALAGLLRTWFAEVAT